MTGLHPSRANSSVTAPAPTSTDENSISPNPSMFRCTRTPTIRLTRRGGRSVTPRSTPLQNRTSASGSIMTSGRSVQHAREIKAQPLLPRLHEQGIILREKSQRAWLGVSRMPQGVFSGRLTVYDDVVWSGRGPQSTAQLPGLGATPELGGEVEDVGFAEVVARRRRHEA